MVTDIHRAFLHAYMETDVHMLLEGTIAELIVKLEPSMYRKYIWKNKNGKQCYLSSSERHSTGHFKQPYYSVNYYKTSN